MNIGNNMKLIGSLTTYPARIDGISATIESILNQTQKLDELILWLVKDEFNNNLETPEKLKELTKKGLIIKWCDENYKSYNKLIFALKEYPNDIIITFDDDIIYNKDCVRLLYEGYKEKPNCIQCHRALRIVFNNDKVLPYKDRVWGIKGKNTKPSYTNFFTGVSGVLYPPKSLHKDVFNTELFKKICPNEDDMWFWAMAVLKDTKINVVKNNLTKIKFNSASTREFALSNSNVGLEGNTEQFNNILKKYPVIYTKIMYDFIYERIISIFCIPIFKIIITRDTCKINLFSIIPFFKKKTSLKEVRYRIFGIKVFSITKL